MYTCKYYLNMKIEYLNVPLDLRNVRPNNFINKDLSRIRDINIWIGNKKARLGDIFDIDKENSCNDLNEIEINISGKATNKIYYLGFKMRGGAIIVHGDIGPFLGYKMNNGVIKVYGSARSWIGAKMKGGYIEVFGDSGDFIGSKLPGEKSGKGMKGGYIIIHGNAGANVGNGMSDGTIIIDGDSGNLTGVNMVGGSILVRGGSGRFTGARMLGGKIVINGSIDGILPSFYIDEIVDKVKFKKEVFKNRYFLFTGDVLVNGVGRLYISYKNNVELLKQYEPLIKEVTL